jgi:hypothetical protein
MVIMSESELVRTLAAVVRTTDRDASELTIARAIVTGLSAAGYEIVRLRPATAEPRSEPPAASPDTIATRRAG